jgi:hypothetical protein
MTNEERLIFLQGKKEVLESTLIESSKCLDILNLFEDTPLLFFGDAGTHNGVIEEIQEYIPWIDLKIEELTAIIENTN